jgi:hypothetical protein
MQLDDYSDHNRRQAFFHAHHQMLAYHQWLSYCPEEATLFLKENARVEGVSAELGVASELVVNLSRRNGVPELAEYCENVPRSSARPHVDLVPGGNGTGTRLTRVDT